MSPRGGDFLQLAQEDDVGAGANYHYASLMPTKGSGGSVISQGRFCNFINKIYIYIYIYIKTDAAVGRKEEHRKACNHADTREFGRNSVRESFLAQILHSFESFIVKILWIIG